MTSGEQALGQPSTERRSFKVLIAVGLALLGVCTCLSMYQQEYTYINFDVLPYLEAARNLIEGKGLTTDIRSPYELKYLPMEQGQVSRQNMRSIGPAFYFWLPLKISNMSEYAVLIWSSFFFLLTLIPMYGLTKKLFGPAAGVAACVLYLLNPAMVRMGYMGYSQVPFLFLVYWGFYFLFVPPLEAKWPSPAAGGILGLAAYFREDARYLVVLGVLYLIVAHRGKHRLQQPLLFVLTYLAATIPKTIYYMVYAKTTTSPTMALMLLNYVGAYGHWSATGYIDLPSVSEILHRYAGDLLRRTFNFSSQYLAILINQYTGILLLAFFGLVVAQREKEKQRFAYFIVAAVVLFFAQYALIIPQDRYVATAGAWLAPLAGFALVEIIRDLYRKGSAERRMLYAIAILLAAYQLFILVDPYLKFYSQGEKRAQREAFHSLIKQLDEQIPKGAYLIADRVYELAWYLRRPCMELPHDVETMNRLAKFGVPNDYYVVLSDWYYQRRRLYDPKFQTAWDQEAPLNGKPLLANIKTPYSQYLVFGPVPPQSNPPAKLPPTEFPQPVKTQVP